MELQPILPEGVAVRVALSKARIAAIWPGLNHLMTTYVAHRRGIEGATAYPFAIQPLPTGFDSGTFSSEMMNRIGWLWTKLHPSKRSRRPFDLDAFELRAAAFSARVTLQFARANSRSNSKKSVKSKTAKAQRRDVRRLKRIMRQTIKYLETAMKRASRQFVSAAGRAAFRSGSNEWQSHLRWMKYRLAYFKPFEPSLVPIRTMQHRNAKRLLQIAEGAIAQRGYEIPLHDQLRHVISLFLNYSKRGRLGDHHHIYMLQHSDDPTAKAQLFDFVERRLILKEATR